MLGGRSTPRSRNSPPRSPRARTCAGYPRTSCGLTSDATRQKGSGRSGATEPLLDLAGVDLVPAQAERARVAGAEMLGLGVLAGIGWLPVREPVLVAKALAVTRGRPAAEHLTTARGVGQVPLPLVGDLVATTSQDRCQAGRRRLELGLAARLRAELEHAAAEALHRPRAGRARPAGRRRRASGRRRRGCAGPGGGPPACGSGSPRAAPGSGRSGASPCSASTSTCCRTPAGSSIRSPPARGRSGSARAARPGSVGQCAGYRCWSVISSRMFGGCATARPPEEEAREDQPAVGEGRDPVLVDLQVAGVGDHVEEGLARGVGDQGDDVPFRGLRADNALLAFGGREQPAAGALEERPDAGAA